MEWINIGIAATRSCEYLGAEPAERGTWLNLLSLCCIQENSGVIKNCRKLKCRAWQQLAGVTLDEVNTTSDLFHWEGDDLHIEFYPLEQQILLQKKRKGGAIGGRRSGKKRTQTPPKAKDSSEHSLNQTSEETGSTPLSTNEADLKADLERKVKKGKVKKGNTPKSPEGNFPHSKISTIVALYPRRERTMECEKIIADHLDSGISAEAIIAGTKAIAAIIPQLPSGAHNAYLPGALTFFRNRRWEDDPQTWLRQAAIAKDGAEKNKPAQVSLGGFTPAPPIIL